MNILYIYWHNTHWKLLSDAEKKIKSLHVSTLKKLDLKNTGKSGVGLLPPTWSNGRCVLEVRIHLILARLSFVLLWQAVNSAAYA